MKKPGFRKKLLAFAGAALLALIVWTLWGNTALMVTNITVKAPRDVSGLRIAHVSDLHNAEFGAGNRELLGLLAEQEPDLIAVTGDLVDSRHTDMNTALSFVGEAVEIAPVYYVPGNHEARLSDYGELRAGLEAAGAVVLEDRAVKYMGANLIGLSDPDFALLGDIFGEVPAMTRAKLSELTDPGGYNLLLSHRPELFETYKDSGIDLVLTGHAHGGQFRLPFIGGLIAPNQGFFPKYDSGLYTDGRTNMVVSRGLGNSIIPLRFNNRPEIVIVELVEE